MWEERGECVWESRRVRKGLPIWHHDGRQLVGGWRTDASHAANGDTTRFVWGTRSLCSVLRGDRYPRHALRTAPSLTIHVLRPPRNWMSERLD